MSNLSPQAMKELANQGVTPEILAKILANLDRGEPTAQLTGFESNGAADSLPLQGSASPAAPEPPGSPAGDAVPRMTRGRLQELKEHLSRQNWQILDALYRYRFLFTNQIQRLFFTDAKDKRTNTINANRMLNRLRDYGLIQPLKRQSRGYRAGSVSLIWHLTEGGYKLLNLQDSELYSRKRFDVPSTMFIEHTLAIAETAVQLTTICRSSKNYRLKTVVPGTGLLEAIPDKRFQSISEAGPLCCNR